MDYAREVDESWLDGVRTVGVTGGASVPEVLVRGVLEWLAERGWTDVEEVTTADERVVFSLPRELKSSVGNVGRPNVGRQVARTPGPVG